MNNRILTFLTLLCGYLEINLELFLDRIIILLAIKLWKKIGYVCYILLLTIIWKGRRKWLIHSLNNHKLNRLNRLNFIWKLLLLSLRSHHKQIQVKVQTLFDLVELCLDLTQKILWPDFELTRLLSWPAQFVGPIIRLLPLLHYFDCTKTLKLEQFTK